MARKMSPLPQTTRNSVMDNHNFHKIVDALPEHIAVMDNDGTIVFVNQAWKTFADKNHLAAKNHGIGVNYIGLCKTATGPGSDQAADIAEKIDALLSGRIDHFTLEYPCHSPDRHRWFRFNLTWFAVNNERWAVASHENITQLKETAKNLAEKESKLKGILGTVPDAMCMFDPRLNIVWANEQAKEIFGPGIENNKCFTIFKKTGVPCSTCVVRNTFKDGKSHTGEYTHFDAENKQLTFLCRTSIAGYDRDNTPSLVMETLQDITEQKKMFQDLEQAKIRAEAGIKAKNDFMATISHEIRTPMNAILGMSRLALDAGLSSDQYQRISHIQSAGKALMNIITDILDFAKIDAGNPAIKSETFQFGDIMEKIIAENESTAREKNIELVYTFSHELPVFMEGDGNRLTQIIGKLVENAVKYTSAGEVTITSDITFQEGQALCLTVTVADTGIGMTRDQVSHLFEPFTQADGSSDRVYGGTGLGLAIVKQITDAMNGKLRVDSTPGKGSVFTVSLPFSLSSAAAVFSLPVETSSNPRNNKPDPEAIIQNTFTDKKILIVDDDPVNREIVTAFIEKTGAKIQEADNGAKAVEQISSSQFHLVFMDLEMPGMDGCETTRKIRRLQVPWASDMPIVALTGHDPAQIQDQCFGAGMNDCLTKPINMQGLTKILDKWLQGMQTSANVGNRAETVIDMKAGLAYVDNHKPLYIKMLKKFTTTYDQTDKAFAAAFKEKDIQSMKFSAHNLCSIGTMIGAVTLGESARNLLSHLDDEALIKKNYDRLHQEVTPFCALIKQVVAAAFSLLCTLETTGPAVEKQMHILLDLIQKHQPAECRDVLARIKTYDISQTLLMQLAAVETLINHYRFRDAEKKLALLTKKAVPNTEQNTHE